MSKNYFEDLSKEEFKQLLIDSGFDVVDGTGDIACENKIIQQINSALEELKKAKSNVYGYENLARMNIAKAEGILETIKVML